MTFKERLNSWRERRGEETAVMYEEDGTMKMMGVIIQLLVKKSGASSYINSGKPNVTAIYKDVLDLLECEGISKKGISRAAFAAKAKQALLAIHNLD